MKDFTMNIMTKGNMNFKVGLVIMASGLGKRFGSNKLMEPLNNMPLIKWVLNASDELFDARVVVTRSNEVKELCANLNIDCILHDFPNRNDTVKLGLDRLKNDIDYCFFMVGDQPLISKETIKKMIMYAGNNKDRIVRAGFGEVLGSPIGFPKSFFDELLCLPKGKGGSFVAKNNPSSVNIFNVNNDFELWDVDTRADLDQILNVICLNK